MNRFIISLILLLLSTPLFAGTYTAVLNTNYTIDGDTFCGGACDGDDIIIIAPGNWNNYITIQDLKGSSGNPVTIKNGAGLVNIDAGWVGVWFRNCEYIELSGTGDVGYTYGIKVHDGTNVGVYAEDKTDEIKIEYIEITTVNIGIHAKTSDDIDGNPVTRADWTQNNTTIEHCYIHDINGEGMYLGSSTYSSTYPNLNGVYVNNNLLTDIGYDGIQIGCATANVSVHDNYLLTIGTSDVSYGGANSKTGIVINGGTVGEYYDNTVFSCEGWSLYAQGNGGYNFHDNIFAGTGSYGTLSAIRIDLGSSTIEDNIILQSTKYGIETGSTTCTQNRNLIGDCTNGERSGTAVTEGAGEDANIYYADVSDFGFVIWSDDSDYTNDDFTIRGATSGTVFTQTTGNAVESAVVTGGLTIDWTLTGTEWVATIGADNAITTAFIAGITALGDAQTAGFAAQLAPTITYDDFTRVSATVLRLTLDAAASYALTENETWHVVVPASATTGSVEIIAGPDILISDETPALPAGTGGMSYSTGGRTVEYSSGGHTITAP